MESTQIEKVLVTGVTGFVGSQVVSLLLENNKYQIRASVRDLNKLDSLKKAYGDKYNNIEFVKADLSDKESLVKAINGCQYILHVANPIPGDKKLSDEEQINPARDGMQYIIDASIQNKIKRIVVTSSMATIAADAWKKTQGIQTYNESDFSPLEKISETYARSKIIQEQVIREFLNKQEQEGKQGDYKLEIVTLHPPFIIGPTLIKENKSSPGGIAKILRGDIPGFPKLMLPCIDVRDLALAHLKSLETPNISGERIIISQESLWFHEIGKYLQEEFNPQGYNIKVRQIGYCPLKLASWFDPQVKLILPILNQEMYLENQKSKDILGMEYNRDLRQTIIDMGNSLIDQGLIPDKRKNK